MESSLNARFKTKLHLGTILLLSLFLCNTSFARKLPQFEIHTLNTSASFRAISVVDDSVVWLGGSKGTVCLSTNGGVNWKILTVKGFETADFRSLYAFDSLHAVVANAGSPAVILITKDAGQTWKEVYRNADTAAFFDGIDFWNNKKGVIYGDPIRGRLLMLETIDGGNYWLPVLAPVIPKLPNGEASFAASCSNVHCLPNGGFVIATGGVGSHLMFTKSRCTSFDTISTPMNHTSSTTGVFSFTVDKHGNGILVGGDYKNDTSTINHNFICRKWGKRWIKPIKPTRGYRECVIQLKGKRYLAIGPNGADYSANGGMNWQAASDIKGLHTVRKARKGKLVVAAGQKGIIAIVK